MGRWARLRIVLQESYSGPKDIGIRSVLEMYCITRFVMQRMIV